MIEPNIAGPIEIAGYTAVEGDSARFITDNCRYEEVFSPTTEWETAPFEACAYRSDKNQEESIVVMFHRVL